MTSKFIQLLTAASCLLFSLPSQAEVYTFIGTGDYAAPYNWVPSYPGKTIMYGDEVEITGLCQAYQNLNFEFGSTLTIQLGGSLTLYSSITSLFDGTVNNYGTIENFGDILNTGSISNNGSLKNYETMTNQGSITNYDTVYSIKTLINLMDFNNEFGTLKGKGSFSGFTVLKGTIEPSGFPGVKYGTMSFSGNVDFSNAVFNMQLGGTEAGTDYDSVAVASQVTLTNAVVNVTFGSGYVPPAGSIYNVFKFGSRTGMLPTTNFPATMNVALSITWNANSGKISSEALPVELLDFSAKPNEETVELKWSTASENDNKGFQIEHSLDGKIWKNIGYVNGNGNNLHFAEFHFSHVDPAIGVNYYRLKQEDYSGSFEYSKTISVKMKNRAFEDATVSVFPNPASNWLVIGSEIQSIAQIEIYDVNGKLVSKFENAPTLDISQLPTGSYFLRYKGGNNSNLGTTTSLNVTR
ncbi:MAG: T9SS type A sorting domain-containing protein [Bacteroidetes bacterium]|nr:T9SS type A sorting domain-containing protein [Bacteroidota bacterium]